VAARVVKTLNRSHHIYTIVTLDGREQWFCSEREAVRLFTLKANEIGDRLLVGGELVAWYGEHGITVL